MMKAGVYYGVEDFRVTDFPEFPLEKDGVKIAVKYCGICGTDVHKFYGRAGSHPVVPPIPLGHEISGIVQEIGEEVTHFKEGDRVVVDPNWGCGVCSYCKSGMTHMCEKGKGVVKGMAQYVCPPEENVYHIPDELSLEEAALAEPLSCCVHGMDLLDVHLGDTVAIIGMGTIGSIIVKLSSLAGAAQIIVIETVEEKRKTAEELGATLFINPMKEDVKQVIADAGIENVDKVMECVGNRVTVETAIDIAGKCAMVVLFGLTDENESINFYPYQAFRKELTIKASYVNPNTMDRAIKIMAGGKFPTEKFISRVICLEEVEKELKTQTYAKNGKVIVKIDN